MKGAPTISKLVSLTQASKALRRHPHYIRGWADALGIKLDPAGTALVMTRRDYERLKTRMEAAGHIPAAALAEAE